MTDDAALIARLRDPVYAHKRKDELEAADRIAALTEAATARKIAIDSLVKEREGLAIARDSAVEAMRECEQRMRQAEAERDALRAVYNAAVAWRDSDVEEDDQALESTLVAAIDAARRDSLDAAIARERRIALNEQ